MGRVPGIGGCGFPAGPQGKTVCRGCDRVVYLCGRGFHGAQCSRMRRRRAFVSAHRRLHSPRLWLRNLVGRFQQREQGDALTLSVRDILERGAAAAGLVIGSPVLLCVSAAIALEDGLPILFRQTRVGRHGKQFKLLKFRSMRTGVAGARITSGADNRITRTGRILRKYKLDELPQLWNVLKGDMGLIGPRPEVPPFVDLSDAAWMAVLAVRPGITDLATLLYRDEERLLAQAGNTEEFYRNTILPAKLALNR